jgi:lysyl-tRNA synthetase class I
MAFMIECPICRNKRSIKVNKMKKDRDKPYKCKCGVDLRKALKNQTAKFYVVYRANGIQKWEGFGKDRQAAELREAEIKSIKKDTGKVPTPLTFEELAEWYLNTGLPTYRANKAISKSRRVLSAL